MGPRPSPLSSPGDAAEAAGSLLQSSFNRQLFEASPDCVKILDKTGVLLEMNCNGTGLMEVDDFGAVRGQQWQSGWPPQDRHLAEAAIRKAATGGISRFQAPCPTMKGTLRWWDVTVTPIRAESGAVDLLLAVSRDVTEMVQARQRAQESSERAAAARSRLDAVLDAVPAGIGWASADGRLEGVNAANRHLWGEHPMSEGVDAYKVWNAWWADRSARHGKPLQPQDWGLARALGGEEVEGDLIEIEPFDDPGTRKTVLLRARPIRNDAGRVTGAVVAQVDVSEQVEAEARLRESEAKFRSITDAMPQMVWSTLPNGYHDYYNQQWYAFTGMPSGSTDGSAWNLLFHPDDQARAWDHWSQCLGTGDPYEIEYRLRHHSGEYRWVLGRALPVRDRDGSIVRWMGTCTDIHEQKLARQALEESAVNLREADRRKDDFLAMLAHELRNPLAPIVLAAELIRRAPGDVQRVAQASETIGRQARHMTRMVSDLLDVSRVTRGLVTLDRAPLDLRSAVHEAVEQARPLIEARRHMLSIQVGGEPLWVRGDQARLIQVIVNLLTNAARYTPEGGHIRVSAQSEAREVKVQVQDNGDGIEPALLPHIFELFTQATRSPDRSAGGLGIGLALVRSLVRLHGGKVSASSEGRHRGSIFTVELPRTEPPLQAAAELRVQPAATPLRIAVVDDNHDAAAALVALVGSYGHEARAFHGGEQLLNDPEALAFDVYWLDVGMPGMSGIELARRLRERLGGRQRLIYTLSGYGDEQTRKASRHNGCDGHFTKPLAPQELLDVLARASRRADPMGAH